MSAWGPIHHCHGGCGDEVQYKDLRLFNAGTLARHRCPRHQDEPAPIRFLECLCGAHVDVVGAVRYERHTLRIHVCDQRPSVPCAKPVAAVRQRGGIGV